MNEFESQVKKGFRACKSDIENLQNENSLLKDKILLLQNQNQDLKDSSKEIIDLMTKLRQEISDIKTALNKTKEEAKPKQTMQYTEFSQVEEVLEEDIPYEKEVREPIKQTPTPTKDPYEALLAFKAKANKRDVLKQKMLQMMGDGMNLAELKFMFVDHFRYTSKATFYNYLKELEIERAIRIERNHSKNVVYPSSVKREI